MLNMRLALRQGWNSPFHIPNRPWGVKRKKRPNCSPNIAKQTRRDGRPPRPHDSLLQRASWKQKRATSSCGRKEASLSSTWVVFETSRPPKIPPKVAQSTDKPWYMRLQNSTPKKTIRREPAIHSKFGRNMNLLWPSLNHFPRPHFDGRDEITIFGALTLLYLIQYHRHIFFTCTSQTPTAIYRGTKNTPIFPLGLVCGRRNTITKSKIRIRRCCSNAGSLTSIFLQGFCAVHPKCHLPSIGGAVALGALRGAIANKPRELRLRLTRTRCEGPCPKDCRMTYTKSFQENTLPEWCQACGR